MKTTLLVSVLAVIALEVFAADLIMTQDVLIIEGRAYSNAVVSVVSPVRVTVRHSTGALSIDTAKLPAAVQKEIGYDPQQASAWQSQKRDAELHAAELKHRLEKSRVLQLTINRIMESGILTTWEQVGVVPSGYADVPPRYIHNPPVPVLLVDYPKPDLLSVGTAFAVRAIEAGTTKVNGRQIQTWSYVADAEYIMYP